MKVNKRTDYKITFYLIISIIILILSTAICSAQDNISIGLYQDIRLATVGDDKGNDAFTTDVKLDISLQGYQLNQYYFSVNTQFEYATLKGGDYFSLMVVPNWTLNDLILEKVEVGAGVIIGLIHRWGAGYATYGLSGDVSYMIAPKLKISLLGQLIKRGDLADRWNTKGLSPNVYLGIKYNIK